MAFYIESRYVDIRTLVDFSEFEQSELFLSLTLDDTDLPSENPAPILVPVEEAPTIIEALENITEKIVEAESQATGSTAEILAPVIINEVLKELVKTESAQESENAIEKLLAPLPAPPPAQKPVDKNSLYAKYITDKFGEEAGAELVKILLNPYIVSLVYRYEFSDAKNSAPTISLRGVKQGAKNETMIENEAQNDQRQQTERRNYSDLLEQSRKRDLERKLQKELELKNVRSGEKP